MKYAWFAVGSLFSLFVSMYCALVLLAAYGSQTFEGVTVGHVKRSILVSSASLFLGLSVTLWYKVYSGLKRIH